MEPVVELAVRVASLLSFVRDFFPDAYDMADLLPTWGNRIEQAAFEDLAVLRTLQEFVEPEQPLRTSRTIRQFFSWPEHGEFDPLVRPLERFGIQAVLERFGIRKPNDEQKRAALAGYLALKLRDRLEQLQETLPGVLRLKELRLEPNKGYKDVSHFQQIDLAREEIAERAANTMLADESLVPRVAKALGYTPSLIRELRKNNKNFPENLLADRDELQKYCRQQGEAVPFSFVFSDELKEIEEQRKKRLAFLTSREPTLPRPERRLPAQLAYQSHLFGIALSGGGIRSATFALGVLQGMADRNLLPFIDYLSTVSGGGYIGSWLISWIKRRGSIGAVQESLRGSATCLPHVTCTKEKQDITKPPKLKHNSDPRAEHVRPVRMLREYARYLAPQAGLFSADSWTILTTWLRNTALSLMVLILVLAAFLLLPHAVADLLMLTSQSQWGQSLRDHYLLLTLLAAIPLWVACAMIGFFNLRSFRYWRSSTDSRSTRGDSESTIVASVMGLIIAGAFCKLSVLWGFHMYDHPRWAAFCSGSVFFVGVLIIVISSLLGTHKERVSQEGESLPRQLVGGFFGAIISATVGALLIYALCTLFLQNLAEDTQSGVWFAVAGGLCLLMLILSVVIILLIGILGNALTDEQREWWSRLGAWVSIFTAAWLLICGICFFSPLWIAQAKLSAAAAGISWVAITWAGVKAAFSAKSGRNGDDNNQNFLMKIVMVIAPAVFVIGLLTAISFGLHYSLERLLDWGLLANRFLKDPSAHWLCCASGPFSWQRMVDNYWPLQYPGSFFPPVVAVALFTFGIFLDWRVDINEFSMHHFYKNRLVRAYLGASRPRERRWPNAFTGFDMDDDIRLSRFHHKDKATHRGDAWTNCRCGYIGPYPIINTTLNVTRGDMARQERKAESFIFTPFWSGFDFTRKQTSVPSQSLSEYAFRPTGNFAFRNQGIFLGTAMAISGAAFTSNAGFHTSPSLAFLLTAFNVRLGWWIGNPANKKKWCKSSPRIGLWCLLRELTAQTETDADYLLLSDGGHFENMGLYELVRRRCRYIVVSDAEEDAKFKLEGIGGAIRKCRVDFGVVIDLDLEALQPLGDPAKSRLHYSIGRILYPEHLPGDTRPVKGQENPCGVLIYIKSSITGDEPVDVAEFRKRQPHFPHDSTANQFFDESHFESYRALGHHATQQIFGKDAKEILEEKNDLVLTLKEIFCNAQEIYRKRLEKAKATEVKTGKNDKA